MRLAGHSGPDSWPPERVVQVQGRERCEHMLAGECWSLQCPAALSLAWDVFMKWADSSWPWTFSHTW